MGYRYNVIENEMEEFDDDDDCEYGVEYLE